MTMIANTNDIRTSMTADQADSALDVQLATQQGLTSHADTDATSDTNTDTETTEAAIEVNHTTLDLAKHDCTLTLTNPATGGHRTFRIRTVRNSKNAYMNGKRIVELLTGPDNGSDYLAFGFIGTDLDFEPGRIRVWNKYKGTATCKSEYEKFADMLSRPDYWAGRGVSYLASLRCRRCGRKLTTPESVTTGYGPVCRDKV